MPRILIIVSGSVAACKLPIILNRLNEEEPSFELRVVATQSGARFLGDKALIPSQYPIYTDNDDTWKQKGDAVLHIELIKWATHVVVLPCSANFLARIVNGLADDLPSCCVRAWSCDAQRMMLFPAMNTRMWSNPITRKQVKEAEDFGMVIVPPIAKQLACGDVGVGGLPEVEDCVSILRSFIQHTI